MRRGTRRTIERGIYKDDVGYEVVARAGQARRSKRAALDTPLDDLRAWRDGTAAELREEPRQTRDTRTIAGAVARYLDTIGGVGDPSQYNAWVKLYGTLERRKLRPALAQQAFDRWTNEGYSAQTLRLRRFALQKVWRHFDGPKAKTPVDDIPIKKAALRRPVWVSDDTILAVLMELRRAEMAGRLRSAKTRARFLLLVTTGQRPDQVKRAERGDFDLQENVWWVRAAKGGERVPLYLNAEMRTAVDAFMRAQAWGDYDTRSFARTLRHAGWPKGVRPYNARHAVGHTISARGGDLGDIQLHLGHTSITTTRQFYVPGLEERMRAVSAALDGRFGGRSVAPERGTTKK